MKQLKLTNCISHRVNWPGIKVNTKGDVHVFLWAENSSLIPLIRFVSTILGVNKLKIWLAACNRYCSLNMSYKVILAELSLFVLY